MAISMLFVIWNLYKTHRYTGQVSGDPWDGRTLEWSVASPAPEHPFQPLPKVTKLDAFWYAKLNKQKLPEAENSRPSPIAVETVQPVVLSAILIFMSIGFVYQWVWMQIVGGIGTLGFFIIRALTDERKEVYEKEEDES